MIYKCKPRDAKPHKQHKYGDWRINGDDDGFSGLAPFVKVCSRCGHRRYAE